MHVTSNIVLERFLITLEIDFEAIFEVSAWWDDKQKRQERGSKNLQKHLSFYSQIASSQCWEGKKEACKNLLFSDLTLLCIRNRVWTLSGPRFGSHLGSQNRSQTDPEAIKMGIGFWTSILRGGPGHGGGWSPPRIPGPTTRLYIY